jgi:hypothetical protein
MRDALARTWVAGVVNNLPLLRDLVADGVLKAPRKSRVLYRLAEPGEVLAAGGKAVDDATAFVAAASCASRTAAARSASAAASAR